MEKASLTNFKSTLGNSIKNYISIVVFLLKSGVRFALRKVVVIAPFLERFKAVLYERSRFLLLLKLSGIKQLLFLILLSKPPTANKKHY